VFILPVQIRDLEEQGPLPKGWDVKKLAKQQGYRIRLNYRYRLRGDLTQADLASVLISSNTTFLKWNIINVPSGKNWYMLSVSY